MIRRRKVCVLVSVDKMDDYVEVSVYDNREMAVEMVKGLVEENYDDDEDELELTLQCVEKELGVAGHQQYDDGSTVYHIFEREING